MGRFCFGLQGLGNLHFLVMDNQISSSLFPYVEGFGFGVGPIRTSTASMIKCVRAFLPVCAGPLQGIDCHSDRPSQQD